MKKILTTLITIIVICRFCTSWWPVNATNTIGVCMLKQQSTLYNYFCVWSDFK